ncbi:MAG: DUF3263 domain-containing protein [Terrimesophilobacter sp.]
MTVGLEADGTEPPEASTSFPSQQQLDILEFERHWWRRADAKEQAIRSRFDVSAARYYQMLNAVIDSPIAMIHDPMLVKRLQRLRDARVAARSNGTNFRRESGSGSGR